MKVHGQNRVGEKTMIYHLKQTYFKYNVICKLKTKGQKKIYHANIHFKNYT